ncbi:MAG: hypothetical protein GXO17_03130 [Thermodesulfobacteria bacterium]|nr:hypothetical protein [Thermodesulfobacteriota bacterium]
MSKLKPEVQKKWLYWVSGLLWLGVGLMLCLRAFFWVKSSQELWAWGLYVFALGVSYFMGRFFLFRLARRNLRRLDEKPERLCCFAFQPWRSYLVIAVMIAMGISLRRSDIPRVWLAGIYALMGGALVWASGLYFSRALEVLRQ